MPLLLVSVTQPSMDVTAALPELLGSARVDSCDVTEAWATSFRGLASYTVPKIDVLVSASEHAVRVNPLSAEAHRNYGNALYFARRYEDAVSAQRRAIELEPRSRAAMFILGAAYEALGRAQEALDVFDRPGFRETPNIAEAYARLGRRDDALRVLNGLARRGGPVDLQEMAIAYFALGDKERGFEWLTKAFDQRTGFVTAANIHPSFDGIRDDPRFKALVARLKLPN